MIEETIKSAEHRMEGALEALRRELGGIRSGRAHPQLVEHLRVDYHGTAMPLNQLASIAAPEPRLLTIQPWDRSAMTAIEKAIMASDLGLNPSNDGYLIRLMIPQLTEERRKDMVKIVHRKIEEGRVAIRNVRRDSLEDLRKLQKDKLITEDDERRAQDRLQKLTDRYVVDAEKLGQDKERELMEV